MYISQESILECTVLVMQWPNKQQCYEPVFWQRFGKHVPYATNTYTTIELLLETGFSVRSVQTDYKENNWGNTPTCMYV
jgi:hypothetical protein